MTSFCCTAAAPRLRSEKLLSSHNAVRPSLLAGSARAGAGESSAGFSVENIHLVLVQTLGAAELESLLARPEVQVFFSVTDMLAPITHLWHRGERLWGVIEVMDSSYKLLWTSTPKNFNSIIILDYLHVNGFAVKLQKCFVDSKLSLTFMGWVELPCSLRVSR